MNRPASTPVDLAPPVVELLASFQSRTPVRAGSLIITIFGDAIVPRGGSVWLGSLIRLLADFGVNERQARTSVYRLVQDDWLEATPIGRRSYYRITDSGRVRFEEATRRIYGGPLDDWDGTFVQVVLPRADRGPSRDQLKRELGWLGFGALAAHIAIHPRPDRDALARLLTAHELANDACVMESRPSPGTPSSAISGLVESAWNLDELADGYRAFLFTLSPLFNALHESTEPDWSPRAALIGRLLLIHEYRRIILRAPELPTALLPPDWIGHRAYAASRAAYRLLRRAAERALDDLEREDGALPTARGLAARFA